MTKILRLSLFSLMMMVCGITFAQTTVTFDATKDKSESSTAAKNVSITKDGVTILAGEGIMGNGAEYRIYKNQPFTVTSTGDNITKIEITCTASGTNKYGPGNFTDATAGTYTFEEKVGTWIGEATSITMKASGNQVRATKIVVTLGSAETAKVATPALTPAAGSYIGTQNVSISCATEGAKIYYTLDGTEPSASSTEYTAPIAIATTATLKAIAIKGEDKSSIATADYTILANIANTADAPMSVAEALAAISANNAATLAHADNKVYVKGIINYIKEVNIQYGNATYSIVDKAGDTDTLLIFRGKYIDGAKFTAEDSAAFIVGKEVVVYGNLLDYSGTKEMATNNQVVSIQDPVVEEKPTEPVVKMTWVDYDNPTTAMGEIPAGETARAGFNKISGGSVAFGNTGWGENKITYIQVDASMLTGTITGAKLTVDVSGSSDSKRTTGWGVGYNSSAWSAGMTYETADKTITTLGEQQWTSTKSATTFETKEFDIIGAFENDDDNIVTLVVYETAAAGGYIKNPKVSIQAMNPEDMTTYTVKYVDVNGTDIAEPSVRPIAKGATADATAEDIAPKYNEDGTKKYIYLGGNTTIEAMPDSADNIMTLTFREAEKFNYSVQAVNAEGELMQTLTSGSDFEGETIYAPYGRYIHSYSDSTLYEASATNKEYRKTLTLNEDGAVVKVTYNKSSINNVIYFSEGEDSWGMTATTAGNAPVRSSNAAAGYPAEDDVELTGLSTGKYKLIVGFANSKSSSEVTYDFALAEDTLFSMTSTGINMTVVSSDEFTVLGNYVPLKVLKGGNDLQAIDFFYIQKTGGVPAVAVANIAEAKKQKNGTPIKLTLNDAKVTVQTYAMTGTFVALEDASGAIQLSSNMALEGITEQNALNGELYVSFVDQNSAMQLDLSDSTQYSQFTATPSTFTPAEIKYSEVKDSANLYRFVKLGACKTIYDEEMYMYYAISGKDTIPVIDRFMNMQTWMGYATEVPEQVEYMTGVVMHNGEEFCFYPYAYGEDKAIVGVPTPEDIVVNVTEGDIAAAVEAEKAKVANVGKITINLTEGAAYTVNSSIVAPAALVINGNGATVDATALGANMITTDAAEPAEWVTIDSVAVKDVTVKGLGKALFYSAIKNRNIQNFVVDNSVVEVAKDVVVFDFTKGSVAMNFVVKNSTLYAPTATTTSIYSSQSAQKGSEAGATADAPQTFTFENTTLYNLTHNKNFFTHRQNSQKWIKYVIKNNVVVNSGKANFMTSINGGGDSANPVYEVTTNSVGTLVDGVYTDLSASQLVQSNVMGTLVTSDPMFKDVANGDFTLGEASEQNTNKLGDPRWFAAAPAPSVAYLCGSTTAPDEAIYNALVAAQYDVTPLNYDEVTLTEEIVMNDFAGKYDVVVLAGGTGSGTNLAKSANILLGKVNVLSTKSFWYKHYGTNGGNPGTADAPSLSVAISEGYAEHPLFTGIEGAEFAVFNDMGKSTGRYLQSNGSFADEAYAQTTIATTLGADCIGEAWAGDYGYVIIPVDGAQPEGYLTEDGKKLFVNAVQYLIDGVKFTTGIDGINSNVNVLNGDVYSINGIKVRKAGESLKGLAKGLYIVNGKKFIVK